MDSSSSGYSSTSSDSESAVDTTKSLLQASALATKVTSRKPVQAHSSVKGRMKRKIDSGSDNLMALGLKKRDRRTIEEIQRDMKKKRPNSRVSSPAIQSITSDDTEDKKLTSGKKQSFANIVAEQRANGTLSDDPMRTKRRSDSGSSDMYSDDDSDSSSSFDDDDSIVSAKPNDSMSADNASDSSDDEDAIVVEKILDCRKVKRGKEHEKHHGKVKYNAKDCPACTGEMGCEIEEFLVKWKTMGHVHNTWEMATSIMGKKFGDTGKIVKLGQRKMAAYKQRMENYANVFAKLNTEEQEMYNLKWYLREQMRKHYVLVDRIIDSRQLDGDTQYLVKWKFLSYAECTWEAENIVLPSGKIALEKWNERKQCSIVDDEGIIPVDCTSTPENMAKKMSEYELLGVSWMLKAFHDRRTILCADHIAFGSLAQIVALFTLTLDIQKREPSLLVVSPVDVYRITNDLNSIAPKLNIVSYTGSVDERNKIQELEMVHPKDAKRFAIDIVVTSSNVVQQVEPYLKGISWRHICSYATQEDRDLLTTLMSYTAKHRIVLTEIRSTLEEIQSMLMIVAPQEFPNTSSTDLVQKLNSDNSCEIYDKWKQHVLYQSGIATTNTYNILAPMCRLQRETYRSILKTFYKKHVLGHGHHPKKCTPCTVSSSLQQVANHPFLIPGVKDKSSVRGAGTLLNSSGKLVALDKLLTSLKNEGKRVLLVGKDVNMLAILAEYCSSKRFGYQRIDVIMKEQQRANAIERFTKDGSTDFVFLMSSTAAPLQLGPRSIDVLIFYDVEWKGKNDELISAHYKNLNVDLPIYRFVSEDTLEVGIFKRNRDMLNSVLAHRSHGPFLNAEIEHKPTSDDWAPLLRIGAKRLFAASPKSDRVDLSLDILIEDSKTLRRPMVDGIDGLLQAFQCRQDAGGSDDKKFWRAIMPEPEVAKRNERTLTVDTKHKSAGQKRRFSNADIGKSSRPSDAKKRPRRTTPTNRVQTKADITKAIIRGLLRYGRFEDLRATPSKVLPQYISMAGLVNDKCTSYDRIAKVVKIEGSMEEGPEETLNRFGYDIVHKCEQALQKSFQNKHEVSITIDGKELKAQNLMERIYYISKLSKAVENALSMRDLCPNALKDHLTSITDNPSKSAEFKKFKLSHFGLKNVVPWTWAEKDYHWTTANDISLLLGTYIHGFGAWEDLCKDPCLGFSNVKNLPSMRKERMKKRIEYMIKQIDDVLGMPFPGTLHPSTTNRVAKVASRRQSAPKSMKSTPTPNPKNPIKLKMSKVRQTMKKLKCISNWAKGKPPATVADKILKYVIIIGDHIQRVLSESKDDTEQKLWDHVASYIPLTGVHLYHLYRNIQLDYQSQQLPK